MARPSFKIGRDDYVAAVEAGIAGGGFDGTPAATALRALGRTAKRIAFGYTTTEVCHCPLARLGYVGKGVEDYGDLTDRGRNAGIPSDPAAGAFMTEFDEAMLEAARIAANDDYGTYGVARIV